MTSSAPFGRVVVLNGSSSAGKSTLAAELQARWAEQDSCWVVFSWDDFIPRLPSRWHGVPGFLGDRSEDGCRYTVIDDGPPLEALLRVGPIGRNVLRGYHHAVAAMARAGVNVIVEEVLITEWEWADWTEALVGIDVQWVALRCDVETVERREIERGDRHRGLARGTAIVTHSYAAYDIEIDSTSRSTADLAADLIARLG